MDFLPGFFPVHPGMDNRDRDRRRSSETDYSCHALPVKMTDIQKIENAVGKGVNILNVIGYCIPALIGVLMIGWGVFLNDMDWTLIIVGLGLFLGFGWYAYQAARGN